MPYVVSGGDRVDLEPLDRTVVVRGRWAALHDLRAHLPASLQVIAADEQAGALVLDGDVRHVEKAIQVAKLGRRVRIEPAYHQVGGSPDDLWAPTGRVAVEFPEGWPRTRVDAVLAGRGLRVAESVDEMPGLYFALTDGDSIEAARALLEEDGAIFAEPDFVMRMPRRSGATRRGKPSSVVPRGGGTARVGSHGRVRSAGR